MKYIEIGFGNRWPVRTETEFADGTETEQKGIVGPIKFHSVYFRVWVGTTVFILDVKRGFQRQRKDRKAFKLILGVTSY